TFTASGGDVIDIVTDGKTAVVGYNLLRSNNVVQGRLAGLDAVTGARLWDALVSTVDSATVTGLALTSTLVLASSSDGKLYAFDRATGAPAWTAPGLDSTPAFNGAPFTSCRGGKLSQPIL